MVVAVMAVLIALALRGLGIMVLWNWVGVNVMALPEISFLESMGLFLLASFLVGSVVDKNMMPTKQGKTGKKD